ncbi:hypothetical protein AQJ23_27720 [Streptomyces antibioticus]|nr:hypothetical protein [Streptomyces antibioticus]KUN21855.1 hypothetical protein AQJ23_27720 [Streptomyces antibioticus]
MGVLLYYPTINPPTEVLHQALLYWDGIASVVPRDPQVYDAVVGEELRRLEERELYRPLAFTSDTLNVLGLFDGTGPPWHGGHASSLLREELRRLAERSDPPRPTTPPEAVIYRSKLSYPLEQLLEELGLAVPDGWEALSVSREVQSLIIGVLAREFAHHPDVAFFPYTENETAYRNSVRPASPTGALAWEVELGRLLPVPAPGTPIVDVLAFRDRYADERLRLMRAVHRLLGDLRRDYEHPADVFSQLRHELSQALEDYRAAGRGTRTAWVHRSVTVSVALAAAAGGALLLPDLGWLLGTIGGYALNVATREIRPISRARDEHDFSYLHRVHSTLA